MTQEEQIYRQSISYMKNIFGEIEDFSDVVDAFADGVRWADENPNIEIIKRIFDYAIKHTNILLTEDASKVEWEKLIKQAMEE